MASRAEAPARRGVIACLATALALPPLFLATLYGFAARARLALGRWPAPHHPDPKDLGFDLHHGAVLVALLAMLASPLALLTVAALRPLRPCEARYVQRAGTAFATLFVLAIAFTRADPWRVLAWLMD